jgi:RNA polymerase sigma-70 factor (ECF subfamily)
MELLVAHQDQLFGFIFALVQNLDDAQDVFQQTSVVMWRKFDTFQGGSFLAWACRIAQLEAQTFLRGQRRSRLRFNEAIIQNLTDKAASDDERAHDRLAALRQCLGKLPQAHRQLIESCYAKGASIKEISAGLGRSSQSLCNTLRRIRRLLFDCVNRTLSEWDRP